MAPGPLVLWPASSAAARWGTEGDWGREEWCRAPAACPCFAYNTPSPLHPCRNPRSASLQKPDSDLHRHVQRPNNISARTDTPIGHTQRTKVERLMKERQDVYSLCPVQIDTDGKTIAQVAQEIIAKVYPQWPN